MRRLIGTGTTDSQGQVAITYTGTGAGKLDVIAECGDLQSETYSIIDCLKVDTGTTEYAGTFGNETGTFTRTDSGATVYYDNTNGSSAVQFGLSSVVVTGGESAIDLDIIDCNFAIIQTGRYLDSGTGTQYEPVTLTNQTGKLHIEILENSTVFYLNNEKIKEQTQGETNLDKLSVFFRVTAGNILDFKYANLLIYPI